MLGRLGWGWFGIILRNGTRMGGAGAGAGKGGVVEFAAEEDESSLELLSDGGGSCRCSMLALLQRARMQLRELITLLQLSTLDRREGNSQCCEAVALSCRVLEGANTYCSGAFQREETL